VHLDTIKVLLPTDAQLNFLKNNFKIYIKRAPTCFSVITIIREHTFRSLSSGSTLFDLAKVTNVRSNSVLPVTNVTLARSNSVLPDDDDYTETCWSYFNVNFKIVFKTIQLCTSQ
jgi:hypothetical protein